MRENQQDQCLAAEIHYRAAVDNKIQLLLGKLVWAQQRWAGCCIR